MKPYPRQYLIVLLLALTVLFSACTPTLPYEPVPKDSEESTSCPDGTESKPLPSTPIGESPFPDVPSYSGTPYVTLCDGIPSFTADQYTAESYERYSELDALGRCGIAIACIGIDLMPTEERDEIGSVTPSGWQSVKYDIVSGKYLYNRCHLIGFQLSGENANEKNLITGTRYLNVDGMLPFENMIADYVKETENHVLFRVTPMFWEDELVARGVRMEAYSIEDDGDGICFHVFVYNVQPGIVIDYATGESRLATDTDAPQEETTAADGTVGSEEASAYVLNTATKKFHLPTCSYAQSMSEANKDTHTGSREELIEDGYEPCSRCKP